MRLRTEIEIAGQSGVPFGNRILFRADDIPALTLHTEICEDLWVPISPSSYAALAGATVLLNLSASNITVGKADYRRALVASQSARCLAAYLYSAAGSGESTTDLAWDGHALISENGNLIAESERYSFGAAADLLRDRSRTAVAGADAADQLRLIRCAIEARALRISAP